MSTITVKDSKFASYASRVAKNWDRRWFLVGRSRSIRSVGAFGQPNVDWGNFSRFLE